MTPPPSLAAIGNKDETPISFDLSSNQTVHFKGKQSVKKTGAEKSCMAYGTKLKPIVVFKRTTMPTENLQACK